MVGRALVVLLWFDGGFHGGKPESIQCASRDVASPSSRFAAAVTGLTTRKLGI